MAFGRRSDDTTRSTRTTLSNGSSVRSPTATSPRSPTGVKPKRKGGIFRRIHPDTTNPALQSKINNPDFSGAEATRAQDELRDRGVTPPKRSMGTRIARLRNKWSSNGQATSKTTSKTY